jgi:cysteine synthase
MTADGFVKDCTTLGMVLAAREPGERRPGGIIVDGTAANSAHSPRLSAWRISG